MTKRTCLLLCLLPVLAGPVAAGPGGTEPAAQSREVMVEPVRNAEEPTARQFGGDRLGKMHGATPTATRYGMGYERRMRLRGFRRAGGGRGRGGR